MEIDHLFEKLHQVSDSALAVVIDRQYLTQEQWQQGNLIFGRYSDWDRVPDSVVLGVFGDFAEYALLTVYAQEGISEWLTGEGIVYRTIPIKDIKQCTVGQLRIALDATVTREGTI